MGKDFNKEREEYLSIYETVTLTDNHFKITARDVYSCICLFSLALLFLSIHHYPLAFC